MKMIKTLAFLCLGTTAHATLIRPLDETRPLEVTISREGLTRIKVQDDRILNVFGVSGDYELEADEALGQVFIRPQPLGFSGDSKPLYLTITTEKGHTQDLRLLPRHQAPEALILKAEERKDKDENRKRPSLQDPITKEEIEALIQACRDNRIPLTYQQAPVDWRKSTSDSPHALKSLGTPLSPLPLHLIRGLKGERLSAFTYEIKNTSPSPIALSAEDLGKNPHVMALWIAKKTLPPQEGGIIHVITSTH